MSDSNSKATQPLAALADLLAEARTTADSPRLHAALIEVIDGLIAHVAKQAKMIEDLRSDLGHKQSIVTMIGGGDYAPQQDNTAPV